METGSHYIMPRYIEKYNTLVQNNTFLDLTNPTFNLTIRPLLCDEQLAYGFDKGTWSYDAATDTTTTAGTNTTMWRHHNSTSCRPSYAGN